VTSGIRVPFVNVCNPTVGSGVQMGTFPITISSGCDVGNICASVFQDEAELIDEGVSVFPNPIETSATITFSNPYGEPHALIVYDVQGRVVRRMDDIVNDHVIFQRNDLAGGVYFYSLSTRDELKASGKMLIE
jgi:hypothetical protein